MKDNKKLIITAHYYKETEIIMEPMDVTNLMNHQSTVLKIKQKSIKDAFQHFEKEKDKNRTNKPSSLKTRKILRKYLEDRIA